ncbi:MAG: hypothetical protein AAGF12_05970 [Myxococcota bacterium]
MRQSFSTNIDANVGTQTSNGRRVFTVQAGGTATFDNVPYPATAHLLLDLDGPEVPIERVSWPRGTFRIAPGSPHRFTLRLDGAAAGNFDVTDGFVLVAEASNDRIRGSVFITEAFRLNAPVPVPQVFDPPFVMQVNLSGTRTN